MKLYEATVIIEGNHFFEVEEVDLINSPLLSYEVEVLGDAYYRVRLADRDFKIGPVFFTRRTAAYFRSGRVKWTNMFATLLYTIARHRAVELKLTAATNNDRATLELTKSNLEDEISRLQLLSFGILLQPTFAHVEDEADVIVGGSEIADLIGVDVSSTLGIDVPLIGIKGTYASEIQKELEKDGLITNLSALKYSKLPISYEAVSTQNLLSSILSNRLRLEKSLLQFINYELFPSIIDVVQLDGFRSKLRQRLYAMNNEVAPNKVPGSVQYDSIVQVFQSNIAKAVVSAGIVPSDNYSSSSNVMSKITQLMALTSVINESNYNKWKHLLDRRFIEDEIKSGIPADTIKKIALEVFELIIIMLTDGVTITYDNLLKVFKAKFDVKTSFLMPLIFPSIGSYDEL